MSNSWIEYYLAKAMYYKGTTLEHYTDVYYKFAAQAMVFLYQK